MKATEVGDIVFDNSIGSYLQSIEKTLKQFPFSQDLIQRSEQLIQQIYQRSQDKNLYLGVVGEFSSGKSTFINSLLEDDLLREEIIEGTTTAATILEYGDPIDVVVSFNDHDNTSYREDGATFWSRFSSWFSKPTYQKEKDRLRDFIHKVTSEEEISENLKEVRIQHPSQLLQHGLVIIDTPGANANNPRHKEVAAFVIREHCDNVIFTMQAGKPVSETQLSFIKTYLSETVHRCIFLVTMIDTVRERERARLLQDIKTRLERGLEVQNVQLFSCAPGIYMDELRGEKNEKLSQEKKEGLIADYIQVRRALWEGLSTQRKLLIQERLSSLISRLIDALPEELHRQKEAYQQRHQELIKNQIPDLSTFISQKKMQHLESLKTDFERIKHSLRHKTEKIKEESFQGISKFIYGCTEKKEISQGLEKTVKSQITEAQNKLKNAIRHSVEELQRSAQRNMKKFEKDFSLIYKNLATLGGKVNTGVNIYGPNMAMITSSSDVGDIISTINADEDFQGMMALGGIGLGTTIGTILLPGIGTAIGFALGAFLGGLFGPSLEEVQKDTWNKVQQSIRESIDQAIAESLKGFNRTHATIKNNLLDAIARYFQAYSQLVAQMISRDQQEATELQRKERDTQQEIHKLQSLKEQIQQQRTFLKNLSPES